MQATTLAKSQHGSAEVTEFTCMFVKSKILKIRVLPFFKKFNIENLIIFPA